MYIHIYKVNFISGKKVKINVFHVAILTIRQTISVIFFGATSSPKPRTL